MPGASESYPECSLTISDSEAFRNSKNDAHGEKEDQEEEQDFVTKVFLVAASSALRT